VAASRTQLTIYKQTKNKELFLLQLSVFLHLFLLYSQTVYVILLSAFHKSLACIIFMKPRVKAYASYNYTKV